MTSIPHCTRLPQDMLEEAIELTATLKHSTESAAGLTRTDLLRYSLDESLTRSFNHWVFARAHIGFDPKTTRQTMRPAPYAHVGEAWPPMIKQNIYLPPQTAKCWNGLAQHMELSKTAVLACATRQGLSCLRGEFERKIHPARIVRAVLNSPSNAAIHFSVGSGINLDLRKLHPDRRVAIEQRPAPAAGGN